MLKREYVAWVVLMTSFAVLAGVFLVNREALRDRLHSGSRAVLMRKARECLQQGQADAAGQIYRRLAANYGHREDVLLDYADYLVSRSKWEEAEYYYRQAVDVGQERYGSISRYAVFLDSRDRKDDAIAAFGKYVKRHPNDAAAHLEYGRRLLARGRPGDPSAGIAHLKKAANVDDVRAEALDQLAQTYQSLGMIHESVDTWLRVVSADSAPEKQVFWQDIAVAYEKLEQEGDAADAWDRFLSVFPQSLHGAEELAKVSKRLDSAERTHQAELWVSALTPERRLDKHLNKLVTIDGVSGQPARIRPGDTVNVEVAITFGANIWEAGQATVAFYLTLRKAKTSSTVQLRSEPERLGPLPFWRGDGRKQVFALVFPDNLAPGEYDLEMEMPVSGPRVTLWTLRMGGKSRAGDGA